MAPGICLSNHSLHCCMEGVVAPGICLSNHSPHCCSEGVSGSPKTL
jgi:hypothetical protein